MACPSCGSTRTIKSASDRRKCLAPDHTGPRTYNIEREVAEAEVAEAIEAKQGHAPEHDMRHTVPAGYMVKGVSTLYGPNGEVRGQWVKSAQDAEAMQAVMLAAGQAFASTLPQVEPRKPNGAAWLDKLMACYPIGDAHVGMLSWPAETGEAWDLEIAERIQCGAMAALVDGAPAAEQAVIVNLGDWFHADNMDGVTTRSGHSLDMDGRYAKMIGVGIKVMRQCIESGLTKHKTVRVINVIGNHDDTGALWLSAALSHIYEREPRVLIDASPAPFNYFRHGKTLVGCHHGHTCKPDKLPGVMAADRSEDWGQTTHRYWWLGHVHHQSVKEYPGVSVETFGTLAAKDAYATAGGWRARRDMKCIVLHEEHGEVARHTVNPAMLASAA
ncbi:MAG: oxidoreductase [Minisyncoccia bacterium]